MRAARLNNAKRSFRRGLGGPHMLAFLPAICLAAYWIGGEFLLVASALFTPLVYAAAGGFGTAMLSGETTTPPAPAPGAVARDFLEIARLNGQTTACFQLGIRGLEDIARALGDDAADEARILVQRRISATLREADHVFRLGDARFVVLIAPGFHLKRDAMLDLANRIREAVEQPLSLSGMTRNLSVSIGIASSLNLRRNATADIWLASAAQALSEAVLNGASATRVWSDKLSRMQVARQTLRDDIDKAFEKGEFQTWYQPQINLQTGHLVGVEALARWDHPTLGLLHPAQFIRALDSSGQMEQMRQVILAQSLATLRSWDLATLDIPTLSINLSATELRDPGLAQHVGRELDRTGLTPRRLVFDIPETLVAEGLDDIPRKTLDALSDMGCAIDLDDFGAAAASILSLQIIPLHRVKIDRRLIKGVDTSPEARRVLAAILSMIDRLDLTALADGVETAEEQGVLRDLGCPLAQGTVFAAPMPPAQAETWIRNRSARCDIGDASLVRRVK